jgi:arsenite-transporting ATPase
VDSVVVNRLFPDTLTDDFFSDWLSTQQRSLDQIRSIFDPIPVRTVNILKDEVVGLDRLMKMGDLIYGDEDPLAVAHTQKLYEIKHRNGDYLLTMKLPHVKKEYVDLFKEAGDLVVRIGSFKRHVFLPRALAGLKPGKANLENGVLSIIFPKEE